MCDADLDDIEAKARAAADGEWSNMRDACKRYSERTRPPVGLALVARIRAAEAKAAALEAENAALRAAFTEAKRMRRVNRTHAIRLEYLILNIARQAKGLPPIPPEEIEAIAAEALRGEPDAEAVAEMVAAGAGAREDTGGGGDGPS